MCHSTIHHPACSVLLPFLLSRLGLALAGVLAITYGRMQPEGWHASSNVWLDIWARWDSSFYLEIARHGYTQKMGSLPYTPFFPLYPMLMHLFTPGNQCWHTLAVTGVVLSNTSTTLALWLIYQLTALDHTEPVARRAAWAAALFPTSFFFSAVYTEGLFLLLTVAAFWCARRGQWWAAGFLGALASATRSLGVLLIIPLFLEWQARPGSSWRQALWLLLVPAGLLAYMVYLQAQFGDALLFIRAQSAWGRVTTPAAALERLATLANGDVLARLRSVAPEVAFTLLVIGLGLVMLRRQRASYAAYTGCALALPLGTLQLLAMLRLIIVAFPLYIALADWLSRRLYWLAMALFYGLQIFFFCRWALWYWIA